MKTHVMSKKMLTQINVQQSDELLGAAKLKKKSGSIQKIKETENLVR